MFCIKAKMKDEKVFSTVVDGCDEWEYESREDAEYSIECMKEVDAINGEEWDYEIVEY